MNDSLRRFFRPALFVALGLSSVGCTPHATFPSDSGTEILAPGMYPAPQLMGMGLKATYEKTVGDLPFVEASVAGEAAAPPALVYALPSGVSAGDWKQIGIQTDIDGAREVTRADITNGTPVWEVKQLRIRSNRAEVDVVYPSGGDVYQLATAIFKSEPFGPFRLQSFQRWLIAEDMPTCHHPVEVANAKAEVDAEAAQKAAEEKAAADAEAAQKAAEEKAAADAEAAKKAAEEKAAADAEAAKKAAENEAPPASDLPGDGSAPSAETDAETAAAE